MAGIPGGAMAGVEVAIEEVRRFGCEAYARAGLSRADAEIVVAVQLEADLRGVDTHGMARLPWYVRDLAAGRANPAPSIAVAAETPVSVLLDADGALGQLACVRLAECVLQKVAVAGLALGATRRSNDWGAGAYYPAMLARAGYVAFATTTSVPTLAPYGARTRLFGNNPMVFATPRAEGPPIVLDMALTPVALGKVLRAAAEEREIPRAWGFLDAEGEPTTDPRAALSGVIPAIGGYKGTGLALAMNVLAGILPGGAHTAEVGPGRRGQFLLAISPGLFGDPNAFLAEVEAMVRALKAAEPLRGAEPLLPGEPEQRRADAALRAGRVAYPESVLADLRATADELGVEPPCVIGPAG
jgi:L-2-hydroxycarboxylate dehydrogenase (NAD+)